MKKLVVTIAFGSLALLLRPTTLYAQGDHLLCYRMSDPLQIAATADLIADLQPEFTQKGCTLKKPLQFCVPASKENVQGAPASATAFTGQPLRHDYICYPVKCPAQRLPSAKNVADQFGTRLEQKYTPTMVCVPASKGPLECGSFGRACSGACPPGQQCTKSKTAPCSCQPVQSCGGTPDKAGLCGGTCPTGQGCQPTTTSSGKKVCACGPLGSPCGLVSTTSPPTCGGDCTDATQKCLLDSTGQCSCQSVPEACEKSAPQCGGGCPSPDDVCVQSAAANTCVCQPKPCGLRSGACAGACPSGETCGSIPALVPECGCKPTPCGVDTAGNCGGDCPSGQVCGVDAANNCTCAPVSSQCSANAATGQCSGSCPAGQTCQLIPGAVLLCGCR